MSGDHEEIFPYLRDLNVDEGLNKDLYLLIKKMYLSGLKPANPPMTLDTFIAIYDDHPELMRDIISAIDLLYTNVVKTLQKIEKENEGLTAQQKIFYFIKFIHKRVHSLITSSDRGRNIAFDYKIDLPIPLQKLNNKYPFMIDESLILKKAMKVKANSKNHPCGNPGCEQPGIQQCSRCLSIRYCGRDCQKHHWGAHKKYCQAASAGGGGGVGRGRIDDGKVDGGGGGRNPRGRTSRHRRRRSTKQLGYGNKINNAHINSIKHKKWTFYSMKKPLYVR